MKKLLLLLLLSLSFNSYGEEYLESWSKLFTDEDGITWHINIETIKERDGLVYLWQMNSDKESSSTMLSQNDCDLVRIKYIQMFDYDEPMLEGDSTVVPTDESQWLFLPPDSIGEFILEVACDLVSESLKVRQEWVKDFRSSIEPYANSSSYVPPNASTNGDSWSCVTGYEKHNNGCRPVDIEKNKQESLWVNSIASKVRSEWRYSAPNENWSCEVYVLQKRNGEVISTNVQNCNDEVFSSSIERDKLQGFKNSLERAVYKASPLPYIEDDSVFDNEITFVFYTN